MKNFRLIDRNRIKVGDDYFESIAELKRFNDLNDLQDSSVISDLRRRVRFELVPDQPEMEERTMNGVRIPGSRIAGKGVTFYADFVYKARSGQCVAEIRKGACRDLAIKKTMMLWRYKTLVVEY